MHPQNMHIKNPCAFLTQAEGIASLMPQARRLLELRGIFAAILPRALADSCSIANCKQGKVVVFAPNGAVAAKLNLLRPTLLDRLSQRGIEVTGLDIRVQPRDGSPQVTEKSSKLSPEAAQELDRLYGQLPDSKLKDAVGRMLRRNRGQDAL
jgi:hypothetical protein